MPHVHGLFFNGSLDFCKPACVEQDIVVRTSVSVQNLGFVFACIVHVCSCPSRFVRAINCTFMHGFQNNLAQLLSSRSKGAI